MDTDKDYFWKRVVADGDCLIWTGTLSLKGYGAVRRSPRPGTTAHRFAWQTFMGPVPPGYVVDHLCRNRACVNVEHLEPVPPAVNARRGVEQNPYWGPRPGNSRGYDRACGEVGDLSVDSINPPHFLSPAPVDRSRWVDQGK